MKAKLRSAPTSPRVEDTVLVRNIADVQAEFTRLTHAVDEAKRDRQPLHLAAVAQVLRSAYLVLDSWRQT